MTDENTRARASAATGDVDGASGATGDVDEASGATGEVRAGWRPGPGVRWLDSTTMAGGTPYRVVTLTERGAATVRDLLDGATVPEDPAVGELLDRLVSAGLMLAPPPPSAVGLSVTVVIPARSDPQSLGALLDRIGPDVPVIVVDDGSEPPLAVVADGRENVQVLRHQTSRGPAAARNAGVARASTQWIAFLDADTLPDDGWIESLKGRIDQTDDAAGADAARVVLAAPRIYPLPAGGCGGWFEQRVCALDLGGTPSDVGVGQVVSYVPSAALLVDAQVFADVGGFDEAMQVGEDVDLVWRLAAHGRIRYLPDVRVGHRPRTSLRAALARRIDYGASSADLGRRHPGALRHVDVSIWSFGPWLAGVLIHPLVGLAAATATTAIAPWGMRTLSPSHARRLAAQGHLRAGGALGRWLIRPMAPATLVVSLVMPKVGRRLGMTAAAGLVYLVSLDVKSARTANASSGASTAEGESRWKAARLAGGSLVARTLDDLAYSAGVWRGVLAERTLEPVLPRVRDLPDLRRRRGRHAR
ncbi:mycofactocin system glycosyltransferase [Nakamurella sp. UYEF19]|uniref:mycofactocin biosynthesis glycosyltransferase MftF n=1 Tax=Nakamurella sp. UYEF19 TaxID=1756392 RepID=UPI003399AD01